jgi:hypothetical protein
MEVLNNITSYLTNTQTKFFKKVLFVIFTLIAILIIDNIIGFSYFNNTSKKIEQVDKLNKIISNKSLSASETNKFKTLRTEILSHKNLLQYDYVSIFKISFEDGRSAWGHFISSAWFVIILMVLMLFIGFYRDNLDFEIILIIVIVLEPILALIAWAQAKLFSLIPLIGNGTGNHVLNVLINFFLIFVAMAIHKKLKADKVEKAKSSSPMTIEELERLSRELDDI